MSRSCGERFGSMHSSAAASVLARSSSLPLRQTHLKGPYPLSNSSGPVMASMKSGKMKPSFLSLPFRDSSLTPASNIASMMELPYSRNHAPLPVRVLKHSQWRLRLWSISALKPSRSLDRSFLPSS